MTDVVVLAPGPPPAARPGTEAARRPGRRPGWRAGFVPTLLLVVVMAVLVGGCSTGTDAVDQSSGAEFRFVSSTNKGQTIPVGQRRAAPDITGTDLDGSHVDLATYQGKVIVLNFWASWCAPCRVETPELDKVYRATRADGVQFVGVDIKDDEQNAAAFVRVWKISYPSLSDEAGRTTLRFGNFRPAALPYTIVIDRKGRVAAVYVAPLLARDIQPVVQRLVGET